MKGTDTDELGRHCDTECRDFRTAGLILSTWSRAEGPVSLVSTITGSRPMFVLIYALILSRFLPGFLAWQSGRWMLAMRVIGTVMIVGGLAIIYL